MVKKISKKHSGDRTGAGRPPELDDPGILQVRIEQSTIDEIERYATDTQVSKNRASQTLLDAGLKAVTKGKTIKRLDK